MPLWTSASLLMFAMLLSGCDLLGVRDDAADIQNALGTVEQFGIRTGRFVIRPDSDPAIAYLPTAGFADEFHQVGLRVVFSGNLKPFPEDPVFDSNYPLLEIVEIRLDN